MVHCRHWKISFFIAYSSTYPSCLTIHDFSMVNKNAQIKGPIIEGPIIDNIFVSAVSLKTCDWTVTMVKVTSLELHSWNWWTWVLQWHVLFFCLHSELVAVNERRALFIIPGNMWYCKTLTVHVLQTVHSFIELMNCVLVLCLCRSHQKSSMRASTLLPRRF